MGLNEQNISGKNTTALMGQSCSNTIGKELTAEANVSAKMYSLLRQSCLENTVRKDQQLFATISEAIADCEEMHTELNTIKNELLQSFVTSYCCSRAPILPGCCSLSYCDGQRSGD